MNNREPKLAATSKTSSAIPRLGGTRPSRRRGSAPVKAFQFRLCEHVPGHISPPNCQAVTHSGGTNLVGSDESLAAVLGNLVFKGLRGQRFPCLHDMAEVVEELPLLVLGDGPNQTLACLALRSCAGDDTGRVIRIVQLEVDDSAGIVADSGEHAEGGEQMFDRSLQPSLARERLRDGSVAGYVDNGGCLRGSSGG